MIIIDQNGKRYSLLDYERMEFTEREYGPDGGATWDITEDRVVIREPKLTIFFTTGESLTVEGDEKIRAARAMIAGAVLSL